MEEISTKPYLIRALHEWCTDNAYTPHIVVQVGADTRVPQAYVHEGQITLNISTTATQHLMLDNEHITFQARFGGVSEHVFIPTAAVLAIYARETGTGMGFESAPPAQQEPLATPHTEPQPARPTLLETPPVDAPPPDAPPPGVPRRPTFTVVK